MRHSVIALFMMAFASMAQAQLALKDGYPQQYTVKRGDTVWEISNKYLVEPWRWKELWTQSRVANPNALFPGDVLNVRLVGGEPQLDLSRGQSRGTIKLSPQVRVTAQVDAIPPIPLDKISSFLIHNQVVDSESEFNKAPYVISAGQEQVITGANSTFYGRGHFSQVTPGAFYGIFRQGDPYYDPKTKEFLGIDAKGIGRAEVKAIKGDVATLYATKVNEEIRIGDRLMENEGRAINSVFLPTPPAKPIKDAFIIDFPRGVQAMGVMDVVTINKGTRDGLVDGNVLSVFESGNVVMDKIAGKPVELPEAKAGTMMVFQTNEKTSYAIILDAARQISVMDKVSNP